MHDVNGKELHEGDIVNLRCVVHRLNNSDTGSCNVTLTTSHKRKHDQNHESFTTATSLLEHVYTPEVEPTPVIGEQLDETPALEQASPPNSLATVEAREFRKVYE
jgi:hypothetical protein